MECSCRLELLDKTLTELWDGESRLILVRFQYVRREQEQNNRMEVV